MTTLKSTSADESSGVVEIEQRRAFDDADAHRADRGRSSAATRRRHRRRADCSACAERDARAGDRRRAGAAVGLDDVAVDGEGALAEQVELRDAAERAADEALDLLRAAALLAARGLALGARVRGARAACRTRPSPSRRRVPRRNAGTRSSMLTAQSTHVSPKRTIAEPSAWGRKFGSMLTGRSWSGRRPSCRSIGAPWRYRSVHTVTPGSSRPGCRSR